MTGQMETKTGDAPIVSVIVPTYNSGELLREALDSILAQTYKPIEIIVVDDGSTDQTREIVRAAGAPVHYLYQDNSGGCASPRNHGLRVASGVLLSVFDADDVMHPTKIERQVRFLQEHPDVGIVFSDYVNFSAAGRSLLSHLRTCPELETLLAKKCGCQELVLEPKETARILALENFTIASSPMFRREVYAQIGGYDENLNASADFDFHYRVATRFNTGVLDEIGFYRRLHDANMTGNLPKSLRDVIASRTMLLRRETDRVARQSLRRKIAESYLALGYQCIGHDNAAALMHTVRSLLYRHPVHYGWVRNMAKICLCVVGVGKRKGPALAPRNGRGMRSRPIKIMYVIDRLDGARGGTESQLLQLLRRLDTGTFEPSLAVFRDSDGLRQLHLPCPVTVGKIGKLLSLDALAKLWRLSRAIRRAGVSVVHIFFADASIAAPLFCKLGGAQVVVSKRDMGFWYTPARLAALRVSNLFADRIVANSAAVRDHVARREWVSTRKLTVIPNGHDEERFVASSTIDVRKVLGIGDDEPIVGMIANLHQWKNHAHLLEAFARVLEEHPSAHLVLAGEGDQEEPLRKLARTLGIAGRTHFLGFVPDPIPVIQECAVCVLCSESEGLSNAVIEYMGCGKPTVCTNVGGNRELIEDGVNGYLVDVSDIGSLADRIIRVLSEPALAARLGDSAKRRVIERFSASKMASAYMALYEQLAGGTPAS